jgi:hypothetical protein
MGHQIRGVFGQVCWSAAQAVFRQYIFPENRIGSFKANCKYCTSAISAIGKTTSNLVTHEHSIFLSDIQD